MRHSVGMLISMRQLFLTAIAVMLLASALAANEVPLGEASRIRFAEVDAGREILMTVDDYLSRLSPFDLAARMETDQAVTLEQFKEHLAEQVLPWSEEQTARLRPILTAVAEQLARWELNFPETVLLVRTTGVGEGHAAYTRGHAIVLPDRVLAWPADRLADLLIHELFHILSRRNPELRDQLYRIVGFEPCGEIALPDELARRKITNPDAPVIEHVVRLPIGEKIVSVVPLLLSRSETYDVRRRGTFFDYLQFHLLEVERAGDGWRVAQPNGQPRMHAAETTPSYLDAIGRNTTYIIHPEEVLADNFVMLVRDRKDVVTPHILTELNRHLRLPAPASQ